MPKRIVDPKYPWLVQRPPAKWYHVLVTVNGKEIWAPLGEKNRTRAIEKGKTEYARIMGTPDIEEVRKRDNLTFRDIGEKLKAEKRAKEGGEETYRSWHNQLEKHLYPQFGFRKPGSITQLDWLEYVAQKRKVDPSRAFFNDWKCFTGVMNRAAKLGLVTDLVKVENPDETREKVGYCYSEKQIEALYRHAKLQSIRLHLLMYHTMCMRRGEQCKLEWKDLDLKQGTVTIRAMKNKNRKERTIPLSRPVWDLLLIRKAFFQKNNKTSTYVFPSRGNALKPKKDFRHAFKLLKKAAGITRGRPHDLRHTALTTMFNQAKGNGSDPTTSAIKICAYADLSVDMALRNYLHFTPDDYAQVANLIEPPNQTGQNRTITSAVA